jgi:hypothetical protein
MSETTGRRVSMLIKADDQWLAADKINPIPPHADFIMMFVFNGDTGIPTTEFLREWGAFTFIAQYNGTEFRRRFNEDAVTERFSMMRPSPHVTTK